MTDIRIRNGRVHTPHGAVDSDILISGERISGLVSREDPSKAREEIDARGKVVLPGVIDLHGHLRTPGFTHKEDYVTGSQAAAVGGITTFVDMPNVEPPTTTAALLEEKRRMAERDCLIDWGHFASASQTEQIAPLAATGATGFKIFMIGGGYPHDDRIAVYDHGDLYRSFEEIAKTGLPCLVHPFSQELFGLFARRAVAAKPDVPRYKLLSEVYTRDVLWRIGVAVLLELQKDTGVRLQVLHTHAAGSLRMLKQAKAQGQGVTVALDLKYFHIRRADLDRLGLRAAPGGYVTEDPERVRTIWDSLADGTIDLIDSDHAPHTLDEVERFWHSQGGSPQYEWLLAVLLNDVNQGLMSMETLVRVTAENPARVLGLYPEKGALLPGSSADLVIVDMNKALEVTEENLYTKQKWSPYTGWTLKGWPVLTMLRGTVIAKDRKVVGKPGFGRYIAGRAQDWAEPRAGQSQGLSLKLRTS